MAKNIVEIAVANLDAQIADLERAKKILLAASAFPDVVESPKARKPRGPNRKRGLPGEAAKESEL